MLNQGRALLVPYVNIGRKKAVTFFFCVRAQFDYFLYICR